MKFRGDDSLTCAILADRHAAFADKLRNLLSSVTSSVFLVGDNESLMDGAKRLNPSLIIVDVGFAEYGMTELLREIKASVPEARVIVLSIQDDPAIARTSLAEGAAGVVSKAEIVSELLDAVDAVLAGKTFVSPRFNTGSRM